MFKITAFYQASCTERWWNEDGNGRGRRGRRLRRRCGAVEDASLPKESGWNPKAKIISTFHTRQQTVRGELGDCSHCAVVSNKQHIVFFIVDWSPAQDPSRDLSLHGRSLRLRHQRCVKQNWVICAAPSCSDSTGDQILLILCLLRADLSDVLWLNAVTLTFQLSRNQPSTRQLLHHSRGTTMMTMPTSHSAQDVHLDLDYWRLKHAWHRSHDRLKPGPGTTSYFSSCGNVIKQGFRGTENHSMQLTAWRQVSLAVSKGQSVINSHNLKFWDRRDISITLFVTLEWWWYVKFNEPVIGIKVHYIK